MTTNPRDVMADAMQQAALADPDDLLSWRAMADVALDALCPPGSRVVVDRAGTPCDECNGKGEIYEMGRWSHCNGPCGGSGVVEATTIHALPEQLETAMDRMARGAGAGYVPRAVAPPEDGA